MKICVPSENMDVNLKVFNIIAIIYEAKASVKYIPCDCKCKFSSTIYNSTQKWNNDKYQCEYKIKVRAKNIVLGILVHVFVKIARF